MKKLLYISTLILICVSCKHGDDLFKSYGKDITVNRQVEAFTSITAGEKFDVFLVQDSIRSGDIEITAGENVIDGYTTTVQNGELFIRNDNKFNWVRKLNVRQRVVVYFRDIENIQIHGSAKFVSEDTIYSKSTIKINHGGLEDANLLINGDYIFVDCTNTGGVNLAGRCFLVSASVDDISFINSSNLDAEKCYLKSFSKDDSYVDARNVMEIISFGTGNIYYRTAPSATVSIQAKGIGKVLEY